MKKSLAIAGIVGTLGLATLGGVSAASAMPGTDASGSLIERLASKFNVSTDEVKAVFDEDRTARQAEKLQAAVDDGTITAAQKTAIEAKLAELKTARESRQTALKDWATQNGVDAKYVSGRSFDAADLQTAVDDGKITAAQKSLIETKRQEIEAERASRKTALQAWADQTGVDVSYVSPTTRGNAKPDKQ